MLLTISSLLFTSNFIYADNEEKLNDQLIENQQEQQELDKPQYIHHPIIPNSSFL